MHKGTLATSFTSYDKNFLKSHKITKILHQPSIYHLVKPGSRLMGAGGYKSGQKNYG
jgi:hypothetical protein